MGERLTHGHILMRKQVEKITLLLKGGALDEHTTVLFRTFSVYSKFALFKIEGVSMPIDDRVLQRLASLIEQSTTLSVGNHHGQCVEES
jgi:hypothetical protein